MEIKKKIDTAFYKTEKTVKTVEKFTETSVKTGRAMASFVFPPIGIFTYFQ